MILTEQAVAAAPMLRLVATGDHASITALGQALGRDQSNTSKSVKAYEAAGWMARDDGKPTITEAGRDLLASLDRAHGDTAALAPEGFAREIPLDLIDEEEGFNPRLHHDPEAHEGLTASIRERGVLQPIKVRPSPVAGRFRVVFGARRRRAALAAGLTVIPAMVDDLGDDDAFEQAVIENVQSADMTPLEEAGAFERIIARRRAGDPDLSLKEAKEIIAEAVRKTVRYVELRLQLRELPPIKQAELAAGKLSITEARKWLQNRPTLFERPASQWLIILEAALAISRAAALEACRCHAPDPGDTDLKAVMNWQGYMISVHADYEDGVQSNLAEVALSYNFTQQAALYLGAAPTPEIIAERVATLRREVLGDVGAAGLAALGPERYATPWLNGPFEIDPEIVARREAAAKASEQQRAANAKAHEAAQRRHAAAIAAAVALKEKSRGVAVFTPAELGFAEIAASAGVALPVVVTERGWILDARGRQIVHCDYVHNDEQMARQTLIAVAINAAGGVATPEPPNEPKADAIPRTGFVAAVAGLLIEDCDDLPEDDAEALFEATERAGRALDAYLAAEDIDYGDDGHDWDETGAMALAQGIREDGLGQAPAPDAGDEDPDLTPALRRLAGAA